MARPWKSLEGEARISRLFPRCRDIDIDFTGAIPFTSIPSNDMSSINAELRPKCVATTGDAFQKPAQKHVDYDNHRSNLFRHAKFSADGTTIITQNDDHCLRTFLLPTDLLDGRDEPHMLEPYSHFQSGTNLQSYAIYPRFDLQDLQTTLVLSASSQVPITLRNALHYDTIYGSYPFVNTLNEEHRTPRSLAFTSSGDHFIAGSWNVIAAFDLSRPGEEAISRCTLKSSKNATQVGTMSLSRKGWISAMSASSDGMFAIGTTEREIALFEDDGLGRCTSSFSLQKYEGTGITGLRWSPCGRYLLVAERSSDDVQVFDIRGASKELSRLTGRAAKSNQILDMDVISNDGFEVWAGGTDGRVRIWTNPGSREGLHEPDAVLEMHECKSARVFILTLIINVFQLPFPAQSGILLAPY